MNIVSKIYIVWNVCDKFNSFNDLQNANIPWILVILSILNVDKFISFNSHAQNIPDIIITLSVLNDNKFNSFSYSQKANISDISITLSFLNEDKFKSFNL